MRTTTARTRRRNSTKIVASAALVVAAAGVAGLGTFGSFTSATSASESVATGTVKIDLANQAARGLDVAATNMVAGDYAQRAVQLTRSATSESLGSLKLTTTAATANLLKSGTDGLKVAIDSCATPWAKSASANDLVCAGTVTSVLAKGAVDRTDVDLPAALTTLNADRTANLRIEVSLPQAANNDYQNLTNSVGFAFTATQRTAEAR